jgi:hypothetical protein
MWPRHLHLAVDGPKDELVYVFSFTRTAIAQYFCTREFPGSWGSPDRGRCSPKSLRWGIPLTAYKIRWFGYREYS